MRTRSTAFRQRRAQRGTAFVVVMLVLVVLTILGLALALITQSELLIGSNERLVNRVFYTADSGIALATARAIVTNDRTPHTEDFNITTVGSQQIADRVELTPFYPILDAPCNLCSINNETAYNSLYKRLNHALTSYGYRTAIQSGNRTEVVAQKAIAAMVDIQPMRAGAEALEPGTRAGELDRIKF